MKNLCVLKDTQPKIAACITMYNEEEAEFKTTLTGLLQNYNVMYMDEDLNLRQQDMVVVCVCDGFDKIPQSFRKYATRLGFLDEELLKQKDFMKQDRDGKWTMKTM